MSRRKLLSSLLTLLQPNFPIQLSATNLPKSYFPKGRARACFQSSADRKAVIHGHKSIMRGEEDPFLDADQRRKGGATSGRDFSIKGPSRTRLISIIPFCEGG
ncbi:hypothetical protein AVEN_176770-1 [Araneus ventricosus]|uniref:Uncharacterized protein n=1 Tax=Araneus ventricosus TaxID=182803 RepID=A0A4Y2LGN0_ARAVE|nr:hypothetical protein AVEN_176770-1 [Araneus ventricosus]